MITTTWRILWMPCTREGRRVRRRRGLSAAVWTCDRAWLGATRPHTAAAATIRPMAGSRLSIPTRIRRDRAGVLVRQLKPTSASAHDDFPVHAEARVVQRAHVLERARLAERVLER